METIPHQQQMMTTKNELFLLQAGMNEYRTGDNKALAGATRPVALNRPCGAHGGGREPLHVSSDLLFFFKKFL